MMTELERDENGHAWHLLRCQRCGVWKHATGSHFTCTGERHHTVEPDWTPAVPLGMFGDNSSLGLGLTLPRSEPEAVSSTAGCESTAFDGGTSGGGGGGADFSGSTAEAPSSDAGSSVDVGSHSDAGSSYDSGISSDAGGSSDFGSGGGSDL